MLSSGKGEELCETRTRILLSIHLSGPLPSGGSLSSQQLFGTFRLLTENLESFWGIPPPSLPTIMPKIFLSSATFRILFFGAYKMKSNSCAWLSPDPPACLVALACIYHLTFYIVPQYSNLESMA